MTLRRKFGLWRLRRQARKVQAIAKHLDTAMLRLGLSRRQRRNMWREIIKSPDVRQEAFGSLIGMGE